MGEWVVTVCAIAILSVMCDVILPEGQTRKYVRTVFGIIVTLVMIKPVLSFISPVLNTDADYSEIKVQQSYIDSVTRKKNEAAVNSVKNRLEANGVDVRDVQLADNGESVTVYLNVSRTEQAENAVQSIVSAYFPKMKIITYWK